MKQNLYSVLDVKTDTYSFPFCAPTHGAATRAFADMVNDRQTSLSRHPADYKLVFIGTFDDAAAVVESVEERVSLGFATEYVTKEA